MDPAHTGARVAFFGGSFDPPHLGHLAVARAARNALQLDAVLFAPVGTQPLKPLGATASFDDRLAMTRLAVAGESRFEVSLIDAPRPDPTKVDQPGRPNYTIDTLAILRAVLPQDARLFCLVGADSLFNLRHWHRAADIPFAAELIVASRPGQPLEDLASALPEELALEPVQESVNSGVDLRVYQIRDGSGRSARFYLLPGLHVEISASEIRAQAGEEIAGAQGEDQLLPPAVAEYIRAHGLYR